MQLAGSLIAWVGRTSSRSESASRRNWSSTSSTDWTAPGSPTISATIAGELWRLRHYLFLKGDV